MLRIIHLIGPTCAGKSSIIDAIKAMNHPAIGVSEIGKRFRAKYLDPASPYYDADYFKGQAQPAHTDNEAWQFYQEDIAAAIAQGKKTIVVDGQPRSVKQVRDIIGLGHPSFYVLIHASEETRAQRAVATRTGDSLALAKQRLKTDFQQCYEVLVELHKQNRKVHVLDSDELNVTQLTSQVLWTNF